MTRPSPWWGHIAKAHRRYKHAAKEHGYLGCQVDTEEEVPGTLLCRPCTLTW